MFCTEECRLIHDEHQGVHRMTHKVVLVVGGTSGVGRETVQRLTARGDQVIVTGTSTERMHMTVREAGDRVHGVLADITDPEAMAMAVREGLETFGRIDAVVVSAGRGSGGDLLDGDPATWRDMVLTNVLGPAVAVRAALPSLLEGRGQVVLLGSVFGRIGASGSMYSATKWAATGYAESLRQQLVDSGVRVCVLQPGRIDTPWWPEGAPPPALRPEDVASCVLWILDQPVDVDVNEVVVRPVGQRL